MMGMGSWRSMLSRKYLWYAIPAFFYVALLILQFNALTLVHPALMTTLMQTSSFTTALLQYIVFERVPHCAQAAALVGVSLLACSYTLGGTDSGAVDSGMLGILLTLGAACCRAPFGLAMEYVGSKMQNGAENPAAERLRGIITIDFGNHSSSRCPSSQIMALSRSMASSTVGIGSFSSLLLFQVFSSHCPKLFLCHLAVPFRQTLQHP